MVKRKRPSTPKSDPIEWGGVRAERVAYESGVTIFRQGEPATAIIYIEKGSIRLSVVSHAGREAVIAVCTGATSLVRVVWRASPFDGNRHGHV